MEADELADQTVKFLSPYLLTEAGKAMARGVGQDVWKAFRGAVVKLFNRVKEKFGGHPEAAADLAKLEKDPESPERKAVVREQLVQFIQNDPEFRSELEMLLRAARASVGDEIIQTVTVSHGTAGNITQIGKVTGN